VTSFPVNIIYRGVDKPCKAVITNSDEYAGLTAKMSRASFIFYRTMHYVRSAVLLS